LPRPVAQSDADVEMLFRQAGVIRADTLEEMFDAATLLATQPLPRGNRTAIISNSGGVLTICADACESRGLAVAGPQMLDLGMLAPVRAYETAVQRAIEHPEVDALIVIFACVGSCDPRVVGRAIRRGVLRGERRTGVPKPVLLCLMGAAGALRFGAGQGEGGGPGAAAGGGEMGRREAARSARGTAGHVFPSYRFPESAAMALSLAVQYAAFRRQPPGRLPWYDDVDAAAARREVAAALAASATAAGDNGMEGGTGGAGAGGFRSGGDGPSGGGRHAGAPGGTGSTGSSAGDEPIWLEGELARRILRVSAGSGDSPGAGRGGERGYDGDRNNRDAARGGERDLGCEARGALGPELRSAAPAPTRREAAARSHHAADRSRHPRRGGSGGPAAGLRHRGPPRASVSAHRRAAVAVEHDGRHPALEKCRRHLARIARRRCAPGPHRRPHRRRHGRSRAYLTTRKGRCRPLSGGDGRWNEHLTAGAGGP
jgi:hypothetical protein